MPFPSGALYIYKLSISHYAHTTNPRHIICLNKADDQTLANIGPTKTQAQHHCGYMSPGGRAKSTSREDALPSELEAQAAAKGKSVVLGDYNDPKVARAFPVQYRTMSGMQERVEEIDRASGRYD